MHTLETPTPEQLSNPTTLDQRQARVAWSLVAEPGDVMVQRAITAWKGDAAAALSMVLGNLDQQPDGTADELVNAIERWKPRMSSNSLLRTIERTNQIGVHVVIPGDPEWPTEKLGRLGDAAPVVLYVRGDPALLNLTRPAMAVVGARAATGYGEHVTMEFAAKLVDHDVTVLSCAAYGVAGMASRSALASNGRTIAVLAGGLDRFYPSGHEALLTRIVANGAVVSELPVGAMPTKWRFLERDRIIVALSDALLVVEAGSRSGALNAARHAKALGMAVGAIPGAITSPASTGCHRLIREFQAECISSSDDALGLLPGDDQ